MDAYPHLLEVGRYDSAIYGKWDQYFDYDSQNWQKKYISF